MAQLKLCLDDELTIEEEASFVRDIDCRADTPVVHGHLPEPVYGQGVRIYPRIRGRRETKHDQEVYLPYLDPLESYDRFFVLFSAGKDSVASILNLIEIGVPKEKITIIHHDINEGSDKPMDWPATLPYVRSFAQALGIKDVRISCRIGGFWGEVYRHGTSQPISFEQSDGKIETIYPKHWERVQELKQLMQQAELEENAELLEACDKELREFGYRMMFPMKGASLDTRWCSAKIKIDVWSAAVARQTDTMKNCKFMVLSGERRAESFNRSRYNEIELHKTHAPSQRVNRIVHVYRNVIDFSERDVWEVLKRNRIIPHPTYLAGWNRCSCSSNPN